MNKRYLNWLIVFGVGAFSSLSVAEEVYHCVGKYNTGAEYNHLYTVDRSILGGTVDLEGQKFKIKNDLSFIYLYAVAVKFNGVDVLFIDNKSLDVEFSSIRFRSILVAKGKCKKHIISLASGAVQWSD